MLKGSNTTISIAHRLSTIQRSDQIIVIGSDGHVAQTGSYRALAADREGAFAKLMEWQMSGGVAPAPPGRQGKDVDPELTEEERRQMKLEEEERERAEFEGAKEEVKEIEQKVPAADKGP